MEISEQYNNQGLKNSLDELHRRIEITEERICEFGDKTVEIVQPENRRKKYWERKKNRVSGTFGTIMKGLAFMSSESQKRGGRVWCRKLSKFGEREKLQIQRA